MRARPRGYLWGVLACASSNGRAVRWGRPVSSTSSTLGDARGGGQVQALDREHG